jgi:DNA polymerase III delta prime subunit
MEELNINKILNREEKLKFIKDILNNFEKNKHNIILKKGIYIYGEPGTGKTTFITNILKEMNYDIIKYDAGDIRNTTVIEEITKHNMSDKNIMSVFNKQVKKIVIIMDEIDGMNGGDKGGINTLIKLIRPKKTKKQKTEDVSVNPIICIGNYRIDKKIKELMKVCNTVELSVPTLDQVNEIIKSILPNVNNNIQKKISTYIQGDLRKLNNIHNIYKNNPELFINDEIIENIFHIKSYNDDTKKITHKIINNYYSIDEHNNIMNETDRTSVGLLWHENIIDVIENVDKNISIPFYISQLDNICFSDYIDRITFQKQIWQFNEMSSLIKTFKNNKMYHDKFNNDKLKKIKYNPTEVRFTKVLTKYSTEYNNSIFIQKLCQKLGMDKKDLFGYFIQLKNNYNDDNKILALFENYDINKLDINRIYRYLEKYTKENANGILDKEIEIDEENDIEEDEY